MIDAYIFNHDTGRGDWLNFPTTRDSVKELFARIGVDGVTITEYAITDYHVGVSGLYGLNENANIDEVNYLASLMDEMSFEQIDSFEAAAIHGPHNGNLKDLINLAYNSICYEYFPGVGDNKELGEYLLDVLELKKLPRWAGPYFDYEGYGRDFSESKGGKFADHGYVYRNDKNFVEFYSGLNMPEEYKACEYPEPFDKAPIKAQLEHYGKIAAGQSAADRPAPERGER